jgi:hypothetical protein
MFRHELRSKTRWPQSHREGCQWQGRKGAAKTVRSGKVKYVFHDFPLERIHFEKKEVDK